MVGANQALHENTKVRGPGVEDSIKESGRFHCTMTSWGGSKCDTCLFPQLLEQALRSHPASEGANRWRNIAEAVGTRTKEECVARFKVSCSMSCFIWWMARFSLLYMDL